MTMDHRCPTRVCELVAAAFTPFCNDGSLNLDMIDDYVRQLHENRVIDVFICGTAGEGLSMTVDERKKVAEKWVEAGKDKLNKIIVQVGSHNLTESKELAAHAQSIGVGAICALPSLFFKPNTVESLVEYCRQIAACAPDLPFYYYHFPHFTDVRLDIKEFFIQGENTIPTLAGVKFQCSHLGDAMMVNTMHKGVFQVMLACDEVYLGAMAMGIDWAIGTTYGLLPNVIHRMIVAFNRGDIQGARAEQMKVLEVVNLRHKYKHDDVAIYKEIMSMSGLHLGPPRQPLQTLSLDEKIQLRDDIDNLGLFKWGKDNLTPPSSPLLHARRRRLQRRPLDRTTSLLTSEPPLTPKLFSHRSSTESLKAEEKTGGLRQTRSLEKQGSRSKSLDKQVSRSLDKQGSITSLHNGHKPLEREQSRTALLTE